VQAIPNEPDCLDNSRLCRSVWELTENTWLAETSQVTVTALRILGIIVAALILRWLAHRAIRRLARRASAAEGLTLLKPLPERVRTTMQDAAGLGPARRAQRAEAIASVLRSATSVAILTVGFLLVLSELDLNLAPLIAGAGIAGVALGFGAQSLVRDVLAGLFILLEDQYGIGDIVDLGEASGVVQAIGLRVTTLRDLQGVLWFVPNGEIRRVGNRSHSPAVVVVDIPIGFAPVAEAAEAVRRGAQRLAEDPELAEDVLEPPEVLGIDSITVEGAVLRTIVKVSADAQWHIGRELRRRQTEALEEAGLAAQILAARVYSRDPGPPAGGGGGQP
jgi:small conductance mechanosensitive channel